MTLNKLRKFSGVLFPHLENEELFLTVLDPLIRNVKNALKFPLEEKNLLKVNINSTTSEQKI